MSKRAHMPGQRGLALIELMVAMMLGLVIMVAVAGVLLSNNQSFRTTRAVTQIQDSVRVGYELLARDIRQAGNMPCGSDIEVVNVLTEAQGLTPPWQYHWQEGIRGLSASDTLSGVDNRAAGTEALILMSGEAGDIYLEDYPAGSNTLTLGTGSGEGHGLQDGDVLMVCNENLTTIFQMSADEGSQILVEAGGSRSPGNCTTGLGRLVPGAGGEPCDATGSPSPYDRNSVIAKLNSVVWYIGDNGRAAEGGRSLYMARLGTGGDGNAQLNQIEVASGVVKMELRYRAEDTSDFVLASAVTNWADINAVEVKLELDSQDQNVSIDQSDNNGRLTRELTSIVAIRNRSL